MAPLTGKVAIVTGSSRGIGRAVAERLGKDGASVVVNYVRNADKSREVVSAIEAVGGRALAVRADMSQIADVRRLFQETLDHFGRLDILVNNAGLFQTHSLAEVTEDEFDAAFALNAKGAFFAFQEAARRMGDGGRIINISSCSTAMSLSGFAVYVGAVRQRVSSSPGRSPRNWGGAASLSTPCPPASRRPTCCRGIPNGERWEHRCPLWVDLDRWTTLRMSSRF
jgi:3-oxoacyl-[acyl-carrier protein] reductase